MFFLVLGCAGCDLGTKLACNVDGDCFDDLTCVSGACYKCAADKAGCACADGSCLHGMVCGAEGTCVDCSETDPCLEGLACDAGRCVACSSDFAGCPCDDGRCGVGLRCSEINQCQPLACSDGSRNGDETDVDCGGSCTPCTEGSSCLTAADCESLACDDGACLAIGNCLVKTDEFPTIQTAVDDPGCSTIILEESLFDEYVRIDRPVEIRGVAREDARRGGTVLRNSLPGPAIEITSGEGTVYLRNLQIRDGFAVRGAGVFSRRDLVVEGSLFSGNRASVNTVSGLEQTHPCGAAVFVEDANLTVRDTTFVDNQAEETRLAVQRIGVESYGGAICVLGSGDLVVEASEFRGNLAVTTADIPAGEPLSQFLAQTLALASGGAIYRSHEGSTKVIDSIFENNEARAFAARRAGDLLAARAIGGAIALPGPWFSTCTLALGFYVDCPPYQTTDGPMRTTIEGSRFVGNVSGAQQLSGGGIPTALAGALEVRSALIRNTTFQSTGRSRRMANCLSPKVVPCG